MRGSAIVCAIGLLVAASGCLGSQVHEEPPRSSSGGPTPFADAGGNEPPVPRVQVLNATGSPAFRFNVGDNVTATAAGSTDNDGSIVNYTWSVMRHGFLDEEFGTRYGPDITLRVSQPGDRLLILQVRDDNGASRSAYASFGVNQQRVETGSLLLTQVPAIPHASAPVGAKNFSLDLFPGALALSINATFPKDASNRVRLEIRAPNGTLLNHTEGGEAPLWAIALPTPGVLGNYTAHVSLVAGVATEFRIEYTAWYGYI